MKERKNVCHGVFPDLECAIFDRVDLALTERVLSQHSWGHLILETESKPSFGKNSFYGRYCHAKFGPTSNPIQLRYSKMTPLPRVPHAKLRMDSETAPLFIGELSLASRTFTGRSDAARVAYVEIAWDFYADYDDVDRHLVSAATQHRAELENPKNGCRTHYFGGRKSERYVCLYMKPPDIAPGVVRLEVRLDSRALRRLHIVRPEDLLLLRNVDFSRLASFCKLRVPAAANKPWQQNAWQWLAEHVTMDVLSKEFAAYYPRSEFLRPSSLDRRVRDMQRKLIC